MCPECLASAAWIVGGAISTGSASALLVKTFRFKSTFDAKHKEKARCRRQPARNCQRKWRPQRNG